MSRQLIPNIVLWIARIWGAVVLLIILIAVSRDLSGTTPFVMDAEGIVLKAGLLLGLFLAYKWELAGGLVATLAIIFSGFWHPLIFGPGILYIVWHFVAIRKMAPSDT